MSTYDYVHDGAEIYRRSFATIRGEADLAAFPENMHNIAVRMVHACGMVDLTDDIRFSPDLYSAARTALVRGCPILCDARMVANGITRTRLPSENQVVCTLDDPAVAVMAADMGTTRSAAAMELWREQLDGSLVVIGNAPTSLFRLLEMIDAGAARPAAILGIPVGFVGAAESKQALIDHPAAIPYLTVVGRRGGSAISAAAVNALANEVE